MSVLGYFLPTAFVKTYIDGICAITKIFVWNEFCTKKKKTKNANDFVKTVYGKRNANIF